MAVNNSYFLTYFVRHRVASNILLILAFALGWYALSQINVKLLPSYRINAISIIVNWPQANAEAVERFLVEPIERELIGQAGIESIKSSARTEYANISIKYDSSVDMVRALANVKDRVSLVKNWPAGAKEPVIEEKESFGLVTSILVWADANWYELNRWAKEVERQLFSLGLDKVEVVGLADEEIVVELDPLYLQQSSDSISRIANWVSGQNVGNVSLGDFYQNDMRYQLSIESSYYHPNELTTLMVSNRDGGWSLFSDNFNVDYQRKKGHSQLLYQQMPAVAFMVMSNPGSNTFRLADIVGQWSKKADSQLPDVIQFKLYNKIWRYIYERIELMLANGVQGLFLIAAVIWLFLRLRILRWVLLGIPVAFSLSLFLLYLGGETVNQIALFGFIMSLGIVVDDTIVVCEAVVQLYEAGRKPLEAVVEGISFMGGAVLVSSMTTIAAFLPLVVLSGAMGDILRAIPIVVMVVILASLVECFLILPRHLYLDLKTIELGGCRSSALRSKLDAAWSNFRDRYLVAGIKYLMERPSVVFGLLLSIFMTTFALLYSGHLAFTFFPAIAGQDIYADIRFVSGTTPDTMKDILASVEEAAYRVQKDYSGEKPMIEMSYQNMHRPSMFRSARGQWGDQYLSANVYARLLPLGERDLDNDTFIEKWHERIPSNSSIDLITIEQPRDGPPIQDIRVTYVGDDLDELKRAAVATKREIMAISGVINIEDNMPYESGAVELKIKPYVVGMGLSANNIIQQLLPVTKGMLLGVDREREEDVLLRLSLPELGSDIIDVLYSYPIELPSGGRVALSALVDLQKKAGFEQVRHYQGKRVVNVLADVDTRVANRNQILAYLKGNIVPSILERYDVEVDYSDQSRMEKDTLREMKYGFYIAILLIYFLLSWSFSSFYLPFIIMLTMPLSLIGAIWGHYWMGFDVSILSLMGFFGLMGIIVNDSIILIKTYQVHIASGMGKKESVLLSVSKRLRPVLLTTLTTVLGLAPLIFESSYQAQFLIPMAVSITFGLLLGTILVFLLVPVMLYRFDAV